MKLYALSLLSLIVVFSGCKKDKQQHLTATEKYDVKFAISDFTQSIGPMSSRKQVNDVGDTLANYVNNLYYRVYNSAGALVNSVDQVSTDANFGTIADRLPAGTYNVFFGASPVALKLSSATTTYPNASYEPSTPMWYDTFTRQLQITVGTTAVSQSVRLQRVIAMLDVTLQDAIPANVAKVVFTIGKDDLSRSQSNDATLLSTTNRTYTITGPFAPIPGGQAHMVVGNTSSATTVTITAYDASNNKVAEKVVSNVTFIKNQRTSLSGSLFTTNNFSVVVNPAWDTPANPTIPFSL